MGAPTNILAAILHSLHAFLSSVILYLLSLGPTPRHIGFVMDGNRRYARGHGKGAAEGHHDGFLSLRRTLEICLKLNIPAVSIYAFAIDNFSRPQEEVDALMRLATTRLKELCSYGDLLQKHGVRLRFIGQNHLLPEEVRMAVSQMERTTARHRNGVLNVCSPYASRDEITSAVRATVSDVLKGMIGESEVDEDSVFARLETCSSVAAFQLSDQSRRDIVDSGKLDLLVRTSNVKRLSDFMLWQASEDTQLHFVKTNWPDFGLTDLLPILLGWQQKVWLRTIGF